MFRAVARPTRLNLNWGVYSSKYGSHPQISAVGDDHGVLIINLEG